MKVNFTVLFLFVVSVIAVTSAWAAETVVDMYALTPAGTGAKIGTISVSETAYGTLFTPALSGLTEGLHGFHVHANGSCGAAEKDGKMVPGLAAGGHYDPAETKSHKGPYDSNGHLGDLPVLYADPAGMATHPVLAPRIHLSELKGHALIIHQGGDNYSDIPKALGGGGARVACGVVE
jgi:superoxide dismutase, Cu-Zn family